MSILEYPTQLELMQTLPPILLLPIFFANSIPGKLFRYDKGTDYFSISISSILLIVKFIG